MDGGSCTLHKSVCSKRGAIPRSGCRDVRARPCHSREVRYHCKLFFPLSGPLAQSVEHRTFNPVVEGSIPSRPTTLLPQLQLHFSAHRDSEPMSPTEMQNILSATNKKGLRTQAFLNFEKLNCFFVLGV